MTPKNAVVVVSILFLIMAMVFVSLYLNKRLADNRSQFESLSGLNNQARNNGPEVSEPTKIIEQKVNKIIEAAKQDPNQDPAQVRQDIVNTINSEIEKQRINAPAPTAEQLKIEQERQKMVDQINNQIKQQINNK